MSTFKCSLREFADIEVAIGYLDTTGEEDFEFSRFPDGEIGIKVTKDGEDGNRCRLSDWIARVTP